MFESPFPPYDLISTLRAAVRKVFQKHFVSSSAYVTSILTTDPRSLTWWSKSVMDIATYCISTQHRATEKSSRRQIVGELRKNSMRSSAEAVALIGEEVSRFERLVLATALSLSLSLVQMEKKVYMRVRYMRGVNLSRLRLPRRRGLARRKRRRKNMYVHGVI